jgi:hypothetical protein
MELFFKYLSKDIIDNVIIPYLDVKDIVETNDFYSFERLRLDHMIFISLDYIFKFKRYKMLEYVFDIGMKYYKYNEFLNDELQEYCDIEFVKILLKFNVMLNEKTIKYFVKKSEYLDILILLFCEYLDQYKQVIVDNCFYNDKFSYLNCLNSIDSTWTISEKIMYQIFAYDHNNIRDKINWIYKTLPNDRIKYVLKYAIKGGYCNFIMYILTEYKNKISIDELIECFYQMTNNWYDNDDEMIVEYIGYQCSGILLSMNYKHFGKEQCEKLIKIIRNFVNYNDLITKKNKKKLKRLLNNIHAIISSSAK